VPRNLKRYYGSGDLHFVTFSCYRRQALLASPRRRDLFLAALQRTAEDYEMVVVGYAGMGTAKECVRKESHTCKARVGHPTVLSQEALLM
jgi:hypothetical protein